MLRLFEWFWRGRAIRETRAENPGVQGTLDQLRFERILRIGNLLLLLTFLGFALAALVRARDRANDLAYRKKWRTSSTLASDGCTSPNQQCRSRYFFHTDEDESPWVEIDLKRKRNFSTVRVLNRGDGYPDRAIPLVIEVSNDQFKWQIVARRTKLFATWNAHFSTATARFVRLRVERKSFLHLQRILILP